MTHPLVAQMRFARSELVRGLDGLSDDDARRRLAQMNSISWIIGHLAWQEQRNWLTRAQGQTPLPQLNELVAYGQPATAPPLAEMWSVWRMITAAADSYLATLTGQTLQQPMLYDGTPSDYAVGTVLQRQIYHYWFHLGECMAIRQLLGHVDLPEFVGDLHSQAPYQPVP